MVAGFGIKTRSKDFAAKLVLQDFFQQQFPFYPFLRYDFFVVRLYSLEMSLR